MVSGDVEVGVGVGWGGGGGGGGGEITYAVCATPGNPKSYSTAMTMTDRL